MVFVYSFPNNTNKTYLLITFAQAQPKLVNNASGHGARVLPLELVPVHPSARAPTEGSVQTGVRRMRRAAFIKYKLFCFFVFDVVTCLVARATDIRQASGTN